MDARGIVLASIHSYCVASVFIVATRTSLVLLIPESHASRLAVALKQAEMLTPVPTPKVAALERKLQYIDSLNVVALSDPKVTTTLYIDGVLPVLGVALNVLRAGTSQACEAIGGCGTP